MPENQDITVGSLLTPLLVTDLTVTGGAVAKQDGRVIFLDQALIGDVVSAEVVAVKKRIIEARVTEVLSVSPHATRPICPHFGVCGGCVWQNFSYEASLEWKQRHVQETLIRIGRLDGVDVQPVVPSPLLQGYRNKVTFAFGALGDKTVLGLRQRFSREIVEVTNCILQPEETMRLLDFVREFLQENPLPAYEAKEGYLRFLVVRHPELPLEGKRPYHLEIITAPAEGENSQYTEKVHELAERLMASPFHVTGVVHSQRRNAAPIAEGESVVSTVGAPGYEEEIAGIRLMLSAGAFLQTNTQAASILYQTVAKAAAITPEDTVWDMYCGAGGIGLTTAGLAKKLVGFDIQESAIAAACENERRIGLPDASFHAGNLMKAMEKEKGTPNVIILDPPRSGVAPDVLAYLSQTDAKRIIYVSCDVATQARDIARLSAQWTPMRAWPIDMFPYTPHVENVLLLERK